MLSRHLLDLLAAHAKYGEIGCIVTSLPMQLQTHLGMRFLCQCLLLRGVTECGPSTVDDGSIVPVTIT
jgi:hypothetical protein